MTKIDVQEVVIDGKTYVPKGATDPKIKDGLPFRIVVADRGFVYVGSVEQVEGGLIIHDAQNVRRWGTERGLGQLAKEGPTSKTVLDDVGTVRVPTHAVIHQIDVLGVATWK